MDSLRTAVLVIASVIIVAGGAVVVHRELTAPGRRRVGPLRDVLEVATPVAGLVVLIVAVWLTR